MDVPFLPGTTVEVPEIPLARGVELAARDSALVVVDMQNDFVHPSGSLHVEAALESVPEVVRLLRRARRAGLRVAFTQDTQVPGDPEFEIWPRHCLAGTWGWEIYDELTPLEGELLCVKNRYDGFYGSWLEHFLTHMWRVRRLLIVGTVANICVLHTAASAGLRWFDVVVPASAISAQTEFDQALTLRQISTLYAGTVVRDADSVRFTG